MAVPNILREIDILFTGIFTDQFFVRFFCSSCAFSNFSSFYWRETAICGMFFQEFSCSFIEGNFCIMSCGNYLLFFA